MLFKRRKRLLDRLWLLSKEAYLFLGLNIGIALILFFEHSAFIKNNLLLIESVIVILNIISFIVPGNRIVDSILFDDENRTVTIKFYQYFYLHTIEVPFNLLRHKYRFKLNGRSSRNILEIFSGEKYLCELKEERRGWDKNTISQIIKRIEPS